jgi:membrane-associated protease RseP (regulator of RpoE activity)
MIQRKVNRKTLAGAIILLTSAMTFASTPPGTWAGYSSEDFFGEGSYLGVDTRDVTPDLLADLKLKEEHGVEVTMVDQDAPAGKAGIKERDVILTMNGTAVESVEQLRRMIHEVPAGRVVALGLSRDGQPLTVKVQLADRRSASASFNPGNYSYHFETPTIPPMPELPPMNDMPVSVVVVHSSMRSGLMVENLTPQLGEFFGAKDGQAVLVRSVEKGSRAEKAGFRAGDIITKVNGKGICDAGDFSRALRSQKESKTTITILRDKKEQTITLTLPASRQTGEYLNQSFDLPQIDAKMSLAISQAASEAAKWQPEIALAKAQAERLKSEELQRLQAQLEDARKQANGVATDEIKKQIRELQQQLQDQGNEMKDQLRRELSGRADI